MCSNFESWFFSPQRAEFKSWAVTADWEDPYLTMSPEYVKRQMR